MKESEIRDCLAGVIEKLDTIRPRPRTIGAVSGSLIATIAIGFGGCTPDSPPLLPYGVPEPPPSLDAGAAGLSGSAPDGADVDAAAAAPTGTPTAAPSNSTTTPPATKPLDKGPYMEYGVPDPALIDPGAVAEYMAPDP